VICFDHPSLLKKKKSKKNEYLRLQIFVIPPIVLLSFLAYLSIIVSPCIFSSKYILRKQFCRPFSLHFPTPFNHKWPKRVLYGEGCPPSNQKFLLDIPEISTSEWNGIVPNFLKKKKKAMDKLAGYTLIFENFSAGFQFVVQRGKRPEPPTTHWNQIENFTFSQKHSFLFLLSIIFSTLFKSHFLFPKYCS